MSHWKKKKGEINYRQLAKRYNNDLKKKKKSTQGVERYDFYFNVKEIKFIVKV